MHGSASFLMFAAGRLYDTYGKTPLQLIIRNTGKTPALDTATN